MMAECQVGRRAEWQTGRRGGGEVGRGVGGQTGRRPGARWTRGQKGSMMTSMDKIGILSFDFHCNFLKSNVFY